MRYLILLFLTYSSLFLNSQTLYWVGGSGNFNDPNHWSLSSGGVPANIVPNSKTDVVFENGSGSSGNLVVNFVGSNTAKGFILKNDFLPITFTGSNLSELHVNGDFELNRNTAFLTNSKLFFGAGSFEQHNVRFGNDVYQGDVIFEGGDWNIKYININNNHSLKFNAGTYKMWHSSIKTGNFRTSNGDVTFNIDQGILDVNNIFSIGSNTKFYSDKLSLKVNKSDPQKYQVPQNFNFGANFKVLDPAVVNMVCSANLSSTGISCSGICDGQLILTIDITCAPPPFNLLWSNPSCPTPTLLQVPGPGTYTISNLCACADFFGVVVFEDPINNILAISNVTNIAGQSAIQFIPFGNVQPTCFGFCNGSTVGNLSGSVPPYTVSVNAGLNGTFAVGLGNTTYTNLCAGTNTFFVTDAIGCTRTFTSNLSQPAALASGSAVTNVSCFGACNGSLTISPTGGTAAYTVNFSPGGTFTLPAGGTSSVTGLCSGAAISATVTDNRGCVVNVGPATITQPPALTVTPTQTNVSCSGGCNGTASVAVSGGVAPYSFTWSPGPGNTSSITGLCAGTQTVTITNNAGACSTTQTFNIISPPDFTVTPTITNITCNGLCNGSASVVVAGGNGGPYTFTWSPAPGAGQGTGTISSLCPNSYTATIADALGCFTTAVVTVTAPPAYTVNVATQTIICFGACTGSGSVTVSGNNGAPYGFTWSPVPPSGQGTGTISNLCVGNYTANITDGVGCPTTAVVNITQPSSITPNITTSTISCNGVCDGSINVAPTGGNAPYTFTLITPGGSTLTGAPFTGLCAGTHTLIIRDNVNCSQTFTTNISEPNPLVPSVVTTSVSCFNGCNGTLAGNVNGGTPSYTLLWNTPSGTVAGGAIAGQCAGTYTFLVTDANGCTTNSVVTLNQPTQITTTITPTNPNCFGSCNGILSAVVAGGTPGYTLNWSNGFTGNPNTGLCAGAYTLTVTDLNGCNVPFTSTLTAPPQMTLTVNTASPSCAGSCDGAATVVATGGTPSYTFQFNTFPVTTNVTGTINGLCSGNYIASVTDANGCPLPINFSINNPPALSVAVSSVQTSCNACTGGATVTPSGGTPTYAVVWTNSLGVVVGNNAGISSICPGDYTASVTDAGGCTANATVNVAQTVSVTVLIVGSVIQCFGACTGSAVATPTGGTAPYTYTWSPTGQNTQTATNICSGVHTVTVADLLGCSNTGTINMLTPPDITVTTAQTNVSCFGSCDGILSATATGGTGALTYSWTPGGQTTSSITALCAGNYTLTVQDANSCPKVLTFTVTENPAISATFTTTNPTGCALNNGSICVTPSGGTGGPYTFTWTPAIGNASCITGLGAGAYSVIVSDGVCTTTLGTSITNPSGPTLTVNSSSIACFGASTGAATVTATGTGPFTFTWSPLVPSVQVGNVSTANALPTGTYNISVTDGIGCITSQSIAINQPSSLTVNSVATDPKCNASCDGSITLVTSGATPGYTFAWLPAGITGQGTQTVTALCSGGYTVNITDQNGCIQTRTFSLTAPPALTLSTLSSSVQCFGACNGSIVANAIGGTAPITYTWLPVGGFTGSVTPTIINLCPNVYTVIATDGNSCTATNTVNITQPTALTSTLSSLNVSCSNSCNATASHSVSGGTPTYTFSWSGSPVTTSTIGNLCPGSYTATITDANSCTVAVAFSVTTPAPFAATVTPTNPLCNAACNGSISTNLSGAQGTVSFNWSPVGVGQNPTGLCSGNYTLVAVDAASCEINAVVTLTNPPAVLANVTTTSPACNANCNGVAISNATNVVGAVNYTWLPAGPNSPTNTALCAGNYTLIIQDANGCQDTQTFTLTNPPVLNVNPAAAPATCGSPNGSITVVAVGGTPAYTYTWSPPVVSNASVVVGLPAGIYTVVVSDNNGCTNTVSIPLSNANGPSLTPVSSASINCNGQCTGSASINLALISGGTPNYTVSWVAPPAPSTVNPLINLCAGSYTAQTMDANSCILFTAVTISEPPPITILTSFGLPTCNGICNGSVSISTSGGTGPYSFNWNPLGPNNSATLTNACAGDYTIVITDNNGCPSTQTINLPAALNMAATTSVSANPCFNSCIASATLTSVAGGLPPYAVTWSNGQFGNVATNLCSGIYSVTLTDANFCFNTFTTTITSPPQITATNSIASPSCNLCNGTSTVVAAGGTSPFTYSWTSGATGQVANNLCAGLYQVLITDGNGCTHTQNVPVSNSSGITGEIFNVQNELCAGNCNGAATITPIGGNAPITFSWIAPTSTLNTVSGLCAGNYFVQMTDAQGCIRTASTSISAATSISLSPFITQPTCGSNDGTISIVPAGGAPGYTYTWVPAAGNTPSIINVGAGSYSVTVTDANGCAQNQVFNISNQNAPVITFTQSNIGCFNACTGSITASASGTSSPFTFTWSVGGNAPTVTNLCKGIITLTVTGANGCIALESFTLTDNPPMQLSISNIIQPRCNGDCTGEITLIPSGGTLPYSFTWSPTGNANPQFSLCPGGYTASVLDANSCATTVTFNLIDPPLLVVTSTLMNSSCSSVADGSASVSLAGGTPTYNFNWTGPNSFTANTQDINNVLPGDYTIVVTDANGCNRTNTIQIVPTITIVANAGRDTSFCTNGSVVLSGTNSIGVFLYEWFLAPTPSSTLATTSTLNVTPAIGSSTYILVVTSSVSSCFDSDTVLVEALPLPFVDAGPSYTIPLFSNVIIGGNPSSPTGVTYTWMPPFTLDNGSIPNPLASNTVNINYTLTVTDANGCVASDTIRVDIYPEIKIPNGFSPNSDNRNDRWIIDNLEQFPENIVEVYNRWGELLFYSKGYTVPFDGKYKGKDLPVGTYYYVINLNHPAYPNAYTGPLTIFR